MTEVTWAVALAALLEALEADFGPGVTRLEFEGGTVLVFGEGRP